MEVRPIAPFRALLILPWPTVPIFRMPSEWPFLSGEIQIPSLVWLARLAVLMWGREAFQQNGSNSWKRDFAVVPSLESWPGASSKPGGKCQSEDLIFKG